MFSFKWLDKLKQYICCDPGNSNQLPPLITSSYDLGSYQLANCAVVKNILLIPMKLTTKMNPKILGFNIYMTNFKQAKHPILLNSNSKPLLKKKKNTKIVTANHTHTYKQTCKLKLQYLQE